VDEGTRTDAATARRALVEELRAIEERSLRVRAGLVALGPGTRLPGVHLVARAAGGRVLVPGNRVAEVARLVACDPVPGAPAAVIGSFVWRGRPALALDLGARLGGPACGDSLDAMMVILDGSPTVALLVDDICELVEDPAVAEAGAAGAVAGPVVGTCRVGDAAVAVLAPEALEREAEGVE
jgi:purine-binding chemotaxis protein CheW